MDNIYTYLLDASALVKLVVDEPGSKALALRPQPSVSYTTTLCFVEALGVLKAKRFFRNQSLSEEQYLAACEGLVALVRNCTVAIEEVDITGITTTIELRPGVLEVRMSKLPSEVQSDTIFQFLVEEVGHGPFTHSGTALVSGDSNSTFLGPGQ